MINNATPHPLDDYVEAIFGGRTWKLSLGLRAEIEFERRRQKDIGDVLAKYVGDAGDFTLKTFLRGFSAEDFATLVWCMVMRYHPDVDLEQFIDAISVKDLQKIFLDVMKAAKGFRGQPHPEDDVQTKENNGSPLDRGPTNGKASGRFAASRSGSMETR